MSDYDRMEASLEYDHLFGLNGLSYVWSTGGRILQMNPTLISCPLPPSTGPGWVQKRSHPAASL